MIDIDSLRKTYGPYLGQDMAANAVIKCCDELERTQGALDAAQKALWKTQDAGKQLLYQLSIDGDVQSAAKDLHALVEGEDPK